ncbi:gamma-glutamyltranspeptidase [Xylariales sp. PMI_506]|nr:gamma-glutamyltranspeptidase [Xylariales sp. PMI_506]
MKSFASLPESLLLLLLAAAKASAVPAWSEHQQEQQPLGTAGLPLGVPGSRGGVACESKLCSQIGIDLLERGGNAVDAWVGTQLCVGVIGMQHSGLGGGGFALIRDPKGGGDDGESSSYAVIDFREAAPAAAHRDMYDGNPRGSVWGGLAVAVPGELRGLEEAHSRFGVLPWKAVVHPAAHVARHGFPVTEDLVRYFAYAISSAKRNFLVEDPDWAEDFAPNGKLLGLGETLTRKRYADTLDAIADGGANVFYEGTLAEQTVAAVRAANGSMTLEDMASYRVIFRDNVNITYRGYRLFSVGAPASGAVALGTLKTFEGYSEKDTAADANLTLHRFDEAMRFAYGAHQQLGDPAYVDGIPALEELMLSASGAESTRHRILDDATQPVEHYLAEPYVYTPDSHGTSHVVTADSSGMAVSATSTVNTLFGSLVVVPENGVILNNEMDDFSVPGRSNEFGYAPSPANFIRGGKRPLSSITPIIVEHPNGTLYTVVGAAGGSRIISSTAQVAWRVIEHGADMRAAIVHPRLHDQLMPNVVTFEYTFDNATVSSMIARGHNVTWVREGISAVQGIRFANGLFEVVSEVRQKNSGGLSL